MNKTEDRTKMHKIFNWVALEEINSLERYHFVTDLCNIEIDYDLIKELQKIPFFKDYLYLSVSQKEFVLYDGIVISNFSYDRKKGLSRFIEQRNYFDELKKVTCDEISEIGVIPIAYLYAYLQCHSWENKEARLREALFNKLDFTYKQLSLSDFTKIVDTLWVTRYHAKDLQSLKGHYSLSNELDIYYVRTSFEPIIGSYSCWFVDLRRALQVYNHCPAGSIVCSAKVKLEDVIAYKEDSAEVIVSNSDVYSSEYDIFN